MQIGRTPVLCPSPKLHPRALVIASGSYWAFLLILNEDISFLIQTSMNCIFTLLSKVKILHPLKIIIRRREEELLHHFYSRVLVCQKWHELHWKEGMTVREQTACILSSCISCFFLQLHSWFLFAVKIPVVIKRIKFGLWTVNLPNLAFSLLTVVL